MSPPYLDGLKYIGTSKPLEDYLFCLRAMVRGITPLTQQVEPHKVIYFHAADRALAEILGFHSNPHYADWVLDNKIPEPIRWPNHDLRLAFIDLAMSQPSALIATLTRGNPGLRANELYHATTQAHLLLSRRYRWNLSQPRVLKDIQAWEVLEELSKLQAYIHHLEAIKDGL